MLCCDFCHLVYHPRCLEVTPSLTSLFACADCKEVRMRLFPPGCQPPWESDGMWGGVGSPPLRKTDVPMSSALVVVIICEIYIYKYIYIYIFIFSVCFLRAAAGPE